MLSKNYSALDFLFTTEFNLFALKVNYGFRMYGVGLYCVLVDVDILEQLSSENMGFYLYS